VYRTAEYWHARRKIVAVGPGGQAAMMREMQERSTPGDASGRESPAGGERTTTKSAKKRAKRGGAGPPREFGTEVLARGTRASSASLANALEVPDEDGELLLFDLARWMQPLPVI
jgi:hypothetical protein